MKHKYLIDSSQSMYWMNINFTNFNPFIPSNVYAESIHEWVLIFHGEIQFLSVYIQKNETCCKSNEMGRNNINILMSASVKQLLPSLLIVLNIANITGSNKEMNARILYQTRGKIAGSQCFPLVCIQSGPQCSQLNVMHQGDIHNRRINQWLGLDFAILEKSISYFYEKKNEKTKNIIPSSNCYKSIYA